MSSINNNTTTNRTTVAPSTASQANVDAGLLPSSLQALKAGGTQIQATADGKDYLAIDKGRLRVYDTQGTQVGDFGPVPNQPISYNVGGTTVNFDGSGNGAVGSSAASPSNQYWYSPSIQNIINNVPSDYPAISASSTGTLSGDGYSSVAGSLRSLLSVPANGLDTGATSTNGTDSTDLSGLSTSGSPGASSTAISQPANSISALDFGVKNDGSTDNTDALNQAAAAAKAQGKTLWLPAGTYNHSGVIKANGVSIEGAGSSTVLNATSATNSAIALTGNSPSLSNVAVTVKGATTRSSQPNDSAVLVQNTQNANVSNISVNGASANGIRLDGANNSTITSNSVNGTNADGIALMNGSTNNKVSHCSVTNAWDDSYSSDSYTSDAKQNSNNTFDSDYAGPNKYGRSFCIMGSANDTVSNSVGDGSKWYGIMTGQDPNSKTMVTSGANFYNNIMTGTAQSQGVGVQQADGSVTGSSQGTATSGNAASILGWTPDTNQIDPSQFTTYNGGGSGSAGR